MTKQKYLEINRPEYFKYKQESSDRRFRQHFLNRDSQGNNLWYNAMDYLKYIKEEIKDKINALWEASDKLDEVGIEKTVEVEANDSEQIRKANRRKTDGKNYF